MSKNKNTNLTVEVKGDFEQVKEGYQSNFRTKVKDIKADSIDEVIMMFVGTSYNLFEQLFDLIKCPYCLEGPDKRELFKMYIQQLQDIHEVYMLQEEQDVFDPAFYLDDPEACNKDDREIEYSLQNNNRGEH